LELRQLQHFVAVAEEQHFTRAARRVNIVQSALSTSVQLLERELGAELLVRSTRQVRLTSAGRIFPEKARRVLEAARDARDAVAAAQGLKVGTLNIGAVQSLPAFLDLPPLLAQFHGHYPGVEVRLSQGSAAHLLEGVGSGRLDLAFLPLCEPSKGIKAELIACEALVLVCAPEHVLAGRDALRIEELGNQPFVDFAPEWGTRKLVDRAFAKAGVERHVAFEISDLGTLLQLVGRGLGVALMPEPIAESNRDILGIAQLDGDEICWELVVAYGAHSGGEGTNRAARIFLELLHDAKGPSSGQRIPDSPG